MNDTPATEPKLSAFDRAEAEVKELKVEVRQAEREVYKATKHNVKSEKAAKAAAEALEAQEQAATGADSAEGKKIAKAAVAEAKKTLAEKKRIASEATKAITANTNLHNTLKQKLAVAEDKLGGLKKRNAVQAEKQLPAIAQEVQVRLDKAAKLDGQADDHRLAAAIRTAEAKQTCNEAGIDFDKWFADNIKDSATQGRLSDRTKRFLLMIGNAEDPAALLAEKRAKNAEANRVAREREKAEAAAEPATHPKQIGGSNPQEPPVASQAPGANQEDGEPQPGYDDEDASYNRILELFEKLKASEQVELVQRLGKLIGAEVKITL